MFTSGYHNAFEEYCLGDDVELAWHMRLSCMSHNQHMWNSRHIVWNVLGCNTKQYRSLTVG